MNTRFRKHRRKEWWLVVFVLFGSVCAPRVKAAEAHRVVLAMGTRLEVAVTAQDADDAWLATEAAIQAVDEVEGRLSTWREDSDISRINRSETGQWVQVSGETVEDLALAATWRRKTQRAFDPAIGLLVRSWLSGESGRLPGMAEINELLIAGNADNLEIQGDRVRRRHGLLSLDTGAFGKGIALREAAFAAVQTGAECITLNFGGQVMRAGRCGVLLVSIADPRDRMSEVLRVPLALGSLATSGNSERGITVGTEQVSHIIDPRTGLPSTFSGSVTVLAGDPVTADCLSTALFVMGPEAGMVWIGSNPTIDVDVLWIDADGGVVWASPGFEV